MSIEHLTEKRCGRCKQVKTAIDFGMVKGKVRSYCRECHKAYNNKPDTRTEKRCSSCKEIKSIEEFNRCGKQFQSYCRPCSIAAGRVIKEKAKASGRLALWWRGYYEEVKRWTGMLSKHGITKEEYERLDQEQDGLCAICRKPETDTYKGTVLRLSVDHDHETGKIRGLLCRSCNLAIGKFREDINLLKAALRYLQSANQERGC